MPFDQPDKSTSGLDADDSPLSVRVEQKEPGDFTSNSNQMMMPRKRASFNQAVTIVEFNQTPDNQLTGSESHNVSAEKEVADLAAALDTSLQKKSQSFPPELDGSRLKRAKKNFSTRKRFPSTLDAKA